MHNRLNTIHTELVNAVDLGMFTVRAGVRINTALDDLRVAANEEIDLQEKLALMIHHMRAIANGTLLPKERLQQIASDALEELRS